MPRKKSYNSEYFPDLDKPYRRGLILGLSLAEVFLLLVFLLLLVAVGYAGLVEEEKKQKVEKVEIGEEVKKQYPNILPKEVEEIFIVLKNNLVDDKNIDEQLKEIFEKITKLENDIKRLQKENEELKEAGKDIKKLQNIISKKNIELQELKKNTDELNKKLNKIRTDLNNLKFKNSALESKIRDNLEKIKKLNELIDKDLTEEILRLKNQLNDLKKENESLKVELKKRKDESLKDKNIQEELINRVGQGTLKISCWTKFDSNLKRLRTLNIFDVLIKNEGILIYDRKKHKFLSSVELNKRKRRIPMSQINFNKTLSVNEFLFQTEAMYRHGLDKKGYFSDQKQKYVAIPCLYNIQVYDKTTNDSIYRKIVERGLNQRFNLIILRDEEWPH